MTQPRELVVAEQAAPTQFTPNAAAAAMGMLTDAEFKQRLDLLKAGRDRVEELMRTLMAKGVDYGTVGNVKKPTLLKPGAELLDGLYGLVPDFSVSVSYGDGITSPPISAQVRAEQHVGSLAGPIVGVGHGACNTWEARYRYRKAKRTCPVCSVVGALFKGSAESRLQGRYWCGPRDGGCGETFDADDERITSQVLGNVDNPDPYELENTVVKMAEKRAHVDATLRTTHTSGLFTQDIEDFAGQSVDEEAAAAAAYAAEQAAQAAQNAPQGGETAGVAAGTDPGPVEQPRAAAARQAAPRQAAPAKPAATNGAPVQGQAYKPVTTDPGKCPKHNRPWRSGQRGWYCSAKDDSGRNGYCDLKPGASWAAQQERSGPTDDESQAFAGGY